MYVASAFFCHLSTATKKSNIYSKIQKILAKIHEKIPKTLNFPIRCNSWNIQNLSHTRKKIDRLYLNFRPSFTWIAINNHEI